AHDARSVVLDGDAEASLGELLDLDADVGEDGRLLARVEGVVDALLDRREQRLARVVEAEEVAVLREELRDGDLALLPGEVGGGRRAPRLGHPLHPRVDSGGGSASPRERSIRTGQEGRV